MTRPEIVTVMPVPTDEVANVPTAEAELRVTVSPLITPTSAADEVLIVAEVVRS